MGTTQWELVRTQRISQRIITRTLTLTINRLRSITTSYTITTRSIRTSWSSQKSCVWNRTVSGGSAFRRTSSLVASRKPWAPACTRFHLASLTRSSKMRKVWRMRKVFGVSQSPSRRPCCRSDAWSTRFRTPWCRVATRAPASTICLAIRTTAIWRLQYAKRSRREQTFTAASSLFTRTWAFLAAQWPVKRSRQSWLRLISIWTHPMVPHWSTHSSVPRGSDARPRLTKRCERLTLRLQRRMNVPWIS